MSSLQGEWITVCSTHHHQVWIQGHILWVGRRGIWSEHLHVLCSARIGYPYKRGERKPCEGKGFRQIIERRLWGNLSRFASWTRWVPCVIPSDGYLFLLQHDTRKSMHTHGRSSSFHSPPMFSVWKGLSRNSDTWRMESSSLFRTLGYFHRGAGWGHLSCARDHVDNENGEE